MVRESNILEQGQPPYLFNLFPHLDLKPFNSVSFRSNNVRFFEISNCKGIEKKTELSTLKKRGLSMINFEKMSYRETTLNGHTIVFRMEGEFGNYRNQELRERIMTALKELKKNVIIDLTRVEKIDSTAIALLVESIRVSEEMNTSFKVIGINNKIKSTLEMMDLPTLFDDIELIKVPRTSNHLLYRPKIF